MEEAQVFEGIAGRALAVSIVGAATGLQGSRNRFTRGRGAHALAPIRPNSSPLTVGWAASIEKSGRNGGAPAPALSECKSDSILWRNAAGKKRAAEAEAPALAPKAAKVAWDPLAGLMEGGSADEDSSSDEEGAHRPPSLQPPTLRPV